MQAQERDRQLQTQARVEFTAAEIKSAQELQKDTGAHGTGRGVTAAAPIFGVARPVFGAIAPVVGELISLYAVVTCMTLSALPIARGPTLPIGASSSGSGPGVTPSPRSRGQKPTAPSFFRGGEMEP